MIVAIHQPNYMPWLGFFHKLCSCDIFVLLDSVQFTKRGFQNRTKIKSPQGAAWLTVPVKTKGLYFQKTNDVRIDNTQDWAKKHWEAMESFYKKSSFFSLYAKCIKEVYSREWESLVCLNETLIRFIATTLKQPDKFLKASQLKVGGKSTELLLNICKEVGGNIYLSGISGRNYLKEELFMEAGIQIIYQDFTHPVYKQQFGEFISGLAVIDLLFNHGDKTLDILFGKNL